ncbi:MAG: electron transfer flavoprotein subunit alpha/FixB family protein, partial [Salinisphaera sp.]|nr:electron transfer flavoprotein subunit alpha/FixB family protein [Salinisphaera sp.]
MSSKVLIVADVLAGQLQGSTARAVACAADLAPDSTEVLVLGADCAAAAGQAAKLDGVTRVLTVERSENGDVLAAVFTPQIVAAVKQGGYSHVLVPNSTFGKDLTPRVAAKLGVAMVTDLMKVHGPYEFDRPIYAGNAVITVQAPAAQGLVA